MINKTTNFYPVGIVLMNRINENTDYPSQTGINGQSVVKQILLLNNLYQKAYDSGKAPWPDGDPNTPQQNSPANYSSVHTMAGNAWTVNQ